MEEKRYISVARTLTSAEVDRFRTEWNRLHTIGRMGTPTRFEPGLIRRLLDKVKGSRIAPKIAPKWRDRLKEGKG